MPGLFYPRHALHLAAILEDFSGGATEVDRAVEWDVIPRTAKLERNDVHTADTLAVTLDFREFPFDPRLVRAASVSYFAANTRGGACPKTHETMRFLGVVDVPESSLSEDAQTVTFECRDYTAILLGKRATPAMAVALDRPMDVVLRELLATLPGEQATLLTPMIQGPTGEPIAWPVVPGHSRKAAKLPVDPKDTLWAIIRRIVEAAGLICFVDLDRLVVSTSRTLGVDGSLRDAPRLRVVFGENVSDLRMKRTLTNVGRPVALRQYNPLTGETTTSEWPTSAQSVVRGRTKRGHTAVVTRRTGGARVTHDDANSAEEFVVNGTRTGEELNRHAEAIFRQRARYELEGAFSTHDPVIPQITDGGRAAEDFDAWSIHTATTLFAEIKEQSAVAFAAGASREAKERELVARGYPPEVAAALVTSWAQLARVSLPFIVRKASLTLDGETGFKADVDFMAMLGPAAQGDVAAERTNPAPGARATPLTRGR